MNISQNQTDQKSRSPSNSSDNDFITVQPFKNNKNKPYYQRHYQEKTQDHKHDTQQNQKQKNLNFNQSQKKKQEYIILSLDIAKIQPDSIFNNEKYQIINYYNDMSKYQKDVEAIIGKSTIRQVTKNVWNQWIIRVLGAKCDVHHCIPDIECVKKDRKETIKHIELKKKQGENTQDPELTYDQIEEYVELMEEKYNKIKLQQLENPELLEQLSHCITEEEYETHHNIKNNIKKEEQYSIKCLKSNYSHLCELFEKYAPENVQTLKNFYLFELLFNYSFIDGISYQLAVPPPTMNILKEQLGVEREIFASPLNHYFEKYHSLFTIDKYFGSQGSCFKVEQFEEGGVQVNPPFIETYMTQASQKILHNLEYFEIEKKSFFAFYVLPWDDCEAYRLLVENQDYFIEVVKLYRKKHFYYQINSKQYQSVPFNSYLIFVGNTLGKLKYSEELKNEIIKNFSKRKQD